MVVAARDDRHAAACGLGRKRRIGGVAAVGSIAHSETALERTCWGACFAAGKRRRGHATANETRSVQSQTSRGDEESRLRHAARRPSRFPRDRRGRRPGLLRTVLEDRICKPELDGSTSKARSRVASAPRGGPRRVGSAAPLSPTPAFPGSRQSAGGSPPGSESTTRRREQDPCSCEVPAFWNEFINLPENRGVRECPAATCVAPRARQIQAVRKVL